MRFRFPFRPEQSAGLITPIRLACGYLLPILPVLALGVATARADIRTDPVKVRMEGPSRHAVPGQEFAGTLEFSAARDAEVRDLTLSGPGWRLLAWNGAGDFSLAAGAGRRLGFRAVPSPSSDRVGPLTLQGEVNGKPWKHPFDLSREAYGGLLPSDSSAWPPHRVLPAGNSLSPGEPELSLAALTAIGRAEDSSAPKIDPGREVTAIQGQVIYWHEPDGGDWAFANRAKVYVLAFPASGPLVTFGPVHTDAQGYFSVEVPQGYAHFCVTFFASNNAAVLEDPDYEDDWNWTTSLIDLPAGVPTFWAGQCWPNSHRGALHIMSDLTYIHDAFSDAGYDLDGIDVQWPESDDNGVSWYVNFYEEIHITNNATWADATAGHEYGHYWTHHFAHVTGLPYCNGVCDEIPFDCGHCGWCPEADDVVWMEGIAHLLSRLGTDVIEQNVSFPVWHKPIGQLPTDTQQIAECPGLPWAPWGVEYVWAAAGWDLVDDDRGIEVDRGYLDVFGDSIRDNLDLEMVDVLNILHQNCDVEGHIPYRNRGFFRCAAEYLDEMANPEATRHNLWETAWNCDLDTDEEDPTAVTNVTSTVPVDTPTQTNYITFNWTAATDDMSGVAGYSCGMFSEPFPPDEDIEARATHFSAGPLAPGTYYFSVRAVDYSGRLSTSTTIGPFLISDPGQADLQPETPTGWSASLVLRSSLVAGSLPAIQSDTILGDSVYYNWGERNIGNAPTGNFQDRIYIDGELEYTSSTHYLGGGAAGAYRNQGPDRTGRTGRHTVWLETDGDHTVPEPNETNNIFAKQFVFVPSDLSSGETVSTSDALPDPLAGSENISGVPFYPNCDGYDVELAVMPDVVWVAPHVPDDRVAVCFYERLIGQTGFATALHQTLSNPGLPAATILSPADAGRTSYCLGVSGIHGGESGYVLCREATQNFTLPDTVRGWLADFDFLEVYALTNSVGENASFTLKLVNSSSKDIWMRIYRPGFTITDLNDSDLTLTVAAQDTVITSMDLATNEVALAIVGKPTNVVMDLGYVLSAYRSKPDLEAYRPANWFANLVPQNGLPYDPATDPVPAPTSLTGGSQTTGIYHAIRNASTDASVPTGAQFRVDLDGVNLFTSAFIEPLAPGQEVKMAHSTLCTVRGGRHTLVHRLNANHAIDEDEYGNNVYGRQWVWTPPLLNVSQLYALPVSPEPYGGVYYVTEGTTAPNCDGYRCTTTLTVPIPVLFSAVCADETVDVDLGIYVNADVQEGYTTTQTESQWSGFGTDFVLRYMTAVGSYTHYLGMNRGPGAASGDFAFRAQTTNSSWGTPLLGSRSGTIEANTLLDQMTLTLPPGAYSFTLDSGDALLGFSLHDVSDGFSSKTEPWLNALAVQTPEGEGEDQTFLVESPTPAPTVLALVVWRADGGSLATPADWTVTIASTPVSGAPVEEAPLPARAGLVSARPNPFVPETEIAYELPRTARVTLGIYDVGGRLVRRLVQQEVAAGRHRAVWNGRDEAGRRVSSGVYLVRLEAAGEAGDLRKLILLE